MWTNCVAHAVRLWWRNPRDTYLIVRLTKEGGFPAPHVMFTDSIESVSVSEFKPTAATLRFIRGPLRHLLYLFPVYALLFQGRVREGLGEEHPPER